VRHSSRSCILAFALAVRRLATRAVRNKFLTPRLQHFALRASAFSNLTFQIPRPARPLSLLLLLLLLFLPHSAHATLNSDENAKDGLGQFSTTSSDTTIVYTSGGINNNDGTTVNALGMDYPEAVAIDPVNHYLYVADCTNARVMVYTLSSDNSISTTSGHHTASYVLGQSNLSSNTPGTSQSGMECPGTLAVDPANNRLFVGDINGGSNRVLVFPTPVSDGENASYVLGEATYTSGTCDPSQSCLGVPLGLAYDATNERLFVADDDNRVMVFNVAAAGSGGSATASSPAQGGGDACIVANGLYCWGYNNTGQDGLNNGDTEVNSPEAVAGSVSGWTMVSVGNQEYDQAACGIAGGALYCWGQNTYGEDGIGTTTEQDSPVQVGSLTTWSSVSSGGEAVCGIVGGALYCWGNNANGQLGLGTTTSHTSPTEVGTLTTWTAVSHGGADGCGIAATTPTVSQSGTDACAIVNGALFCWGYNQYGEVGVGNTTQYEAPQQVGTLTTWTAVSAGNINAGTDACGLAGGKLYCWGYNGNGQLGLGNTTNETSPQQVGTLTTWTVVSQGGSDTCGIAGSKLYCWGQNNLGEDGLGNTTQTTSPTQVGTLATWTAISQGNTDSCGIAGGKLYCWGDNAYYQLGLGTTVAHTSPTQVGTLATWTAISQGSADSCGIAASKLYCWGDNQAGEDGVGSTTQVHTPTQVGTLATWTAVTIQNAYNYTSAFDGNDNASDAACGIAGGALYCWGNNNNAEPSFGENSLSPVQVGSLTTWSAINFGLTDVCGIASSTLYCWGYDGYGEDGLGSTTQYTTPQSVTFPGSGSGALYCWGTNTYGEDGVGTTTQNNSPVQVGSLTTWTVVSQGQYDSCGIAGGALYCWGWNHNGELGLGTTVQHTSPVEVGSLTTWTAVSIMQNTDGGSDDAGGACGITAGSLYCWGANTYGNLGLGTTTSHTSPTEVGTLATWTAVNYGGTDACGISNGSLYCWGVNNNGEDGIGTTTEQTSPALVTPGAISSGENASYELGQPSGTAFTSNTAATTASGMSVPEGLAYDAANSRLFVADSSNNRVTVYNVAPGSIANGESASYELGQPSGTAFTSKTGATTQSGMQEPCGVSYDPNNMRLFVGDGSNARVLVFNVGPSVIANGMNASYYLGQTSWTGNLDNVTQSGLTLNNGTTDQPCILNYDLGSGRLFVPDNNANRIEIFGADFMPSWTSEPP